MRPSTIALDYQLRKDEDKIIYGFSVYNPDRGFSSENIYEYDMVTGITTQISANDALAYRYPAIKGVVK